MACESSRIDDVCRPLAPNYFTLRYDTFVDEPNSRSVTNAVDRQSHMRRDRILALILYTLGTALLASADLSGVPSLRTHGPHALFGLLLPGNVVSCAILIYAIFAVRNPWWRVLIAISLFASLISLAGVGLLILSHFLFMNFPGPG